MATFEPTEAEKATASYLDWDDAELGKFAKYVGLTLSKAKDDAEGLHRLTAASCAMMLIATCVDSNAAELTLNLEGYTHKGVPEGDWTLVLKKKRRRQREKREPRLLTAGQRQENT